MRNLKKEDETGQPVVITQREIKPQQFIIGNVETETKLSLGSGLFEQDEWSSSEVAEKRKKTFYDLVNADVCVIRANNIHGKRITWTIVIPSRIQKEITMIQVFDISAKFVSEQNEIGNNWLRKLFMVYMSLIGEKVINL